MAQRKNYKAILDEIGQVVRDTDKRLSVKNSADGSRDRLDAELGFYLIREMLYEGVKHPSGDEDLLKDYRATRAANARRAPRDSRPDPA